MDEIEDDEEDEENEEEENESPLDWFFQKYLAYIIIINLAIAIIDIARNIIIKHEIN